mmetsp:Transcript_5656/g.21410  ORF Transcript_5656/g.21410 Transcript_5656/m.21410 type:complete len:227 (-) Transcript_5656:1112-1792(-)
MESVVCCFFVTPNTDLKKSSRRAISVRSDTFLFSLGAKRDTSSCGPSTWLFPVSCAKGGSPPLCGSRPTVCPYEKDFIVFEKLVVVVSFVSGANPPPKSEIQGCFAAPRTSNLFRSTLDQPDSSFSQKSTKSASQHPSKMPCFTDLVWVVDLLITEDTTSRFSSPKTLKTFTGTGPSTSIIFPIWSRVSVPQNATRPVYSSHNTHPKLQQSIPNVNGSPNRTSGAR